jgi:alcohol dehydrogenase (cytochrome c)
MTPFRIALAASLLASFAPLAAQNAGDAQAVRQGAVLFRQDCVFCHGVGATGGVRGPDLTAGIWVHGASDAEIARTITNGVPGTAMQGNHYNEEEVRQVIAYLRTLQKQAAAPASGDAARGESIFFGSAHCSTCHIVNGRGGRLGPELTRTGSARPRRYLIESIREPNRQLTENRSFGESASLNYDTVTAVTRDGKTIVGVPVNEDTYTVQIMDTAERIHSLEKKSLKSFRHDARSLMPAYGADVLPDKDLDDLVAYLLSLRGPSADAARAESGSPASRTSPPLTAARLVNAAREPQQWLTYSGTYNGQRYSGLSQIDRSNVQRLALQWVFQTGVKGDHETTPLVIDGVMYLTAPQNHAFALDIRTGRPLWHYERNLPKEMSLCCGPQNRGLAALGDTVFLGTLDTHVVALDAKTGRVRWDVAAADAATGHSFTGAPLVVKDKVIVGVAGGEYGIRGFIDAYDTETGKRAWRFHTIPGEGESGTESWAGDSWKRGGAPTWVTGSYDPELNTLYWGTGNPGPQIYGANRKGDNLYSDSLVALDPDTGKLKWHFQFTPHDVHDWDSTHVPVLIDQSLDGKPRKLVAVANRNGFFYLLDRTDGKFLLAKPYTEVTWAKGIDDSGRPVVLPNTEPTAEGTRVCPGGIGGTNWHSPSYSPQTRLMYFFSKEQCNVFLADDKLEPPHRPGHLYIGSGFFPMPMEHDSSAVRAVDPTTGKLRWEFKHFSGAWAGVLSTAGGLVFSGDGQGNFIALDAGTGRDLWHVPLGAQIETAAISYGVDGRQQIAIVAGQTVFVFGLPKTP